MKFLFNFYKKFKEKRLLQREEEERLNILFDSFEKETQHFVKKAPTHPKAALYRLCWKRSIVLHSIYSEKENNSEKLYLYSQFRKIAQSKYSSVAPENLLGRVYLKMSYDERVRLRSQELKRMEPELIDKRKKDKQLACIYIGIDNKNKKPYIGQTKGNPESGWKEHRKNGTGPFKDGASYAEWNVLEESVPKKKLNELESYYIGFFNAYNNGHNETQGNDWNAYLRGINSREKNNLDKKIVTFNPVNK